MAKEKHNDALRTIGEAADYVGVAAHVLRFWESKFSQIKPQKRRGRRYYRPEDVATIQTIKELLYDQGYTIKGVHKFLKGAKKQDISVIDEAPFVQSSAINLFDNLIVDDDNFSISPEFGAFEIAKLKQIYQGLCAARNKLDALAG